MFDEKLPDIIYESFIEKIGLIFYFLKFKHIEN